MNTYKIIFTRENGTQGTDHFTAINERQARKDFGECYRHSTATIISISTPAAPRRPRTAGSTALDPSPCLISVRIPAPAATPTREQSPTTWPS